MSKQPEKIALADRVRPNSEAAPWVCEAIAEQDAELRHLHAVNQELLVALKYCRQKMTYMMNHGEWYTPGKAIDLADAAIAKAGEQP